MTWNLYKLEVVQVPWLNNSFTLPAVIADAELLTSQITIAMIWAATVILAVWNVAGFSFPVIITLTVNPTRGWICRTAPSVAWAIVGTRVDPEGDTVVRDIRKVFLWEDRDTPLGLTGLHSSPFVHWGQKNWASSCQGIRRCGIFSHL